MKAKFHFTFIFFSIFFAAFGQDNTIVFDRKAYYTVMSSDKLGDVDEMLTKIEKVNIDAKNAFSGAMLMKKAGLVGGINNKISTFKDGHAKLEAEIKKDPSNAELRFLRLMIQENAPHILNYYSKTEEDKQAIIKSYKKMPVSLKNIILDYCKHSKVLVATDF